MSQHPIPVVMCSSLAEEGCETTLKALELGPWRSSKNPRSARSGSWRSRGAPLRRRQGGRGVAGAAPAPLGDHLVQPKLTADAVLPKAEGQAMTQTTEKVVVVGASTGGTEALRVLLQDLPADAPGLIIVQHMPRSSRQPSPAPGWPVRDLGQGGRQRQHGGARRALIAPGNLHTLLKRSGARYHVEVREGPLVSRHRPSVDVLFRSAAAMRAETRWP